MRHREGIAIILYAMSDIHGCLEAFEDALELVDFSGQGKLLLLGDYIHGGGDSYGVLERLIHLQRKYPEQVIPLLGNHEEMALSGIIPINWDRYGREDGGFGEEREEKYFRWLESLDRFYVQDHFIFVHAGIEEELEDSWEYSADTVFTEKYPAQTGHFFEDWVIVAGHVRTSEIAGDPRYHDIYFDGQSHYYIDGDVLSSGEIPVLKINTETKQCYRAGISGDRLILPFDEEAHTKCTMR